MALDAWLPVNHEVENDIKLKGVLVQGIDWQIYSTQKGGRALLAKKSLVQHWTESGLLVDGAAQPIHFGKENFYYLISDSKHVLAKIDDCAASGTKAEALAFAESLKNTRQINKEVILNETSIYIEKILRILPTYGDEIALNDDTLLGFWLTGGVPLPAGATERLVKLVSWAEPDDLEELRIRAGISNQKNAKSTSKKIQSNSAFQLAGRPELESFLNEHVIDIIQNQEKYKALGIDFPSAIILHGPPGCGKTFAIERLVEYLGWPFYHIEASSVASPYIHETSKKIATIFDHAIENSPAVIVIDEMEAFLADRQTGNGHHHIEEVAEFLRRIPEAVKNKVLIVAMTNRIEMIDPAILRRGRFDHVVKVGMASEQEVQALLEKLITELPLENGIDVSALAKPLTGRPLSDVAFVVREAARLTARDGKSKLDQESLNKALLASPARNMS
ncbi:MAG: ATP-binding protein [Alphaproteobacteria bacterium]|nr:ATP-binding protein [Alphaproteobacteria bacterium]